MKKSSKASPKELKISLKPSKVVQLQARQAGGPVEVVKLAFFRVGQNPVSFGNLFKFFLRLLIPGVLVRVIQEGQPPVSGFDLLLGGLSQDLQNLIIVRHPEATTCPLGLKMAVSITFANNSYHPGSCCQGRPAMLSLESLALAGVRRQAIKAFSQVGG